MKIKPQSANPSLCSISRINSLLLEYRDSWLSTSRFAVGILTSFLIFSLGCQSSHNSEQSSAYISPLHKAHSHNDYEQDRPLFEALDHGFCSVEADVHLVNGQLLVAHDADEVDIERTLARLYLEPLRKRIDHFKGSVYPAEPDISIQLLIDFKTPGPSTYMALKGELEKYRMYLTRFENGELKQGPITIVISGNRPIQMVASDTSRLAFIDGRLADLNSGPGPELMPLISSSWSDTFTWKGNGPMPAVEKSKLEELVKQTHAQGKKLRFWGHPDVPAVWRQLNELEMDWINTDNIGSMASYLRSDVKNQADQVISIPTR
jgi:glycerophosphoryl diester phosphodiesterase